MHDAFPLLISTTSEEICHLLGTFYMIGINLEHQKDTKSEYLLSRHLGRHHQSLLSTRLQSIMYLEI